MQLLEDYGSYKGRRFRYLYSGGLRSKAILLMHGYNFYAEVWNECGLVDMLSSKGYSIFSLDVPGFPKSKSRFSLNDDEFADFLSYIIDSIVLLKPILLGASASGHIAMDYAVRKSGKIKALIAVGPVGFSDLNLSRITVPTLAVWGKDDKVSRTSDSEIIKRNVKESKIEIIEGAGHACYLDKPQEFNSIIGDFVNTID